MTHHLPSALKRLVCRLGRDEDGAMIVIVALMMTLFLGLLSVGVEVGSWYMTRRSLQTAADAAAIAGALEHARGNSDGITAAAQKEAVRNGVRLPDGDSVVVHNPPTSGAMAGRPDAVEAIVTRQQERLFSGVVQSGPVAITTRAVATLNDAGRACVLALDGTRDAAVRARGNPDIAMAGCMIAANSNAASAIDLGGNTSLDALSLWTVGGVSIDGSADVKLAFAPTTQAWPLPDPYAAVDVGAVPTCSTFNPKKDTVIPGGTTICGNLHLPGGTYTIDPPGTVFIDGGDLKLSGKTSLVGLDSTIVLTNKRSGGAVGGVDIGAGSSLTIHAPSDPGNPFRGIAIYQDRSAGPGNVNKFNGTGTMDISGALYFPAQEVEFSGNNSTASAGCVQIVARAVTFIGTTALGNGTCAAVGAAPIVTTAARLSE
ncbi:MAG TPA: pilus assembly protein TadG-related protein [Azospirillum sp.]|nr:pilus assembly protein TadG-related protein [Azospirillum sp.]